jgi:hypothetical protein
MDSEIDDYYNNRENEYESDEHWEAMQAGADETVDVDETDFEGFSDDDA